ncbi:ABC transporter permease [Edaphobacter albus]|uniref:ABC transporter permease n=1 Tax=Edaphobacter sp. 4G125 TaxID=2763071 RepID=UPI0016461A09|nr:ABC transporter permease [Edaphobacter sp. 4G125]QNI36938.1 ABC transporter permease [Edaphobacter sp. 4G125]
MKLRRGRKDDIDEEIATHLAMAAADREEQGESPDEARRAAAREFGNPLLVREVTRDMWGWEWFDRLMQDLRYAWRQIRRSPGFSFMVVTTLAIGLGATAAMFTIVNRVLLQVLPYSDPQRLASIQESGRRGDRDQTPWPDIEQWQIRTRSFEDIGFYRGNGRSFLEGDTVAEQIDHYQVSTNLFSVLGVSPAIGRGFTDSKDQRFAHAGDENTIVLSDAVWRDAFGARKDILGKIVRISGDPYTVVGVMPRVVAFPWRTSFPQVWSAARFQKSDDTRIDPVRAYIAIARMKRGVRISEAMTEMKVIQADVAKLYTDPYSRDLVTSATVTPYGDSLVKPEVRHALLALFGASGVLWLIACINVTGLLLARATVRQREIAIRGALGASRGRLVRQLMMEGFLLSAGGSLLGLGLAIGLLKIFAHGLATQLSIKSVMPDGRVILVLLVLTIGSAVLSAMWPAWSSARASIEPALRQGSGQAGHTRDQHRLRSLLVVTQIAMSLVLLVSCGLLLRTIYALRHAPLGFRTDHILVGSMAIPSYRFTGEDLGSKLYTPLLERVKALPGVESATLMTEVPLGHTFNVTFSFGGEGNSADAVRKRDFRATLRVVGPDAQKVFGFSMFKGRFFNGRDTAGSQPVVVVNRAFVKEFSLTNDPDKVIGEHLINLEKGKPAIVVGVLDDTRQVSVAKQSQPEIEIYLPQLTPVSTFYKMAEGIAMDLVVRTERPSSSIVPEIKELMRKASPELANTTFTSMDQIVEDSYGNQQLIARLLVVFGCAALLLCLSGLYGLLAQLVTQRTREIGVRMALGADRGAVLWLVMRQAGRMLIAGALIGLALVYFSGRLVSGFLYGVTAYDAWTLTSISALLLASGLVAAYLPARRAAAVDPMEALRAE